MASIMALASGGISPSMAIPPQHFTLPSWRMAQECWCPASIWEKLPGGESRSPVDSVRRSSSPWAPQQMMVPSVLSPQVWNIPAETWTNGAPESFVVLVPGVVPGSSAGAGGVAALVASRGGVGAGTVGVNAAEAAGVGMGVTCSAGCRAGVCSGSASGVGANPESNSPGSVGWPQAASTAASMAAASSTNAARTSAGRRARRRAQPSLRVTSGVRRLPTAILRNPSRRPFSVSRGVCVYIR